MPTRLSINSLLAPKRVMRPIATALIATFAFSKHTIYALANSGITNPAIGDLGNDAAGASSGELFVSIFISLWNTAISIGAILTIVFFLWGAMEWVTASGDTGKVTKGQQKMLQAALGLFVLVFSFILIGFVSGLLFGEEFDILRPQFFAPGDGT